MLIKLMILMALLLIFGLAYSKLKRLPSDKQKLNQRLAELSDTHTYSQESSTELFKQTLANAYLSNIKTQLEIYTDASVRTRWLWQTSLLTITATSLLVWALSIWYLCIAPVLVVVCLSVLFLRHKKNWQQQFLNDMPEALEQMARALSTGMSLLQALIETSKQLENPIKQEFNWMLQRLNIGDSAASVFNQAGARVPVLQYQFFCLSLLLNQEQGGRLAQVLTRQSEQIKAQKRSAQKLLTLTSEPRLTAKVVSAIPVVMFIALFWLNPEHVSFLLHHEKGQQILLYAVGSVLLGLTLMNLMIRQAGGR